MICSLATAISALTSAARFLTRTMAQTAICSVQHQQSKRLKRRHNRPQPKKVPKRVNQKQTRWARTTCRILIGTSFSHSLHTKRCKLRLFGRKSTRLTTTVTPMTMKAAWQRTSRSWSKRAKNSYIIIIWLLLSLRQRRIDRINKVTALGCMQLQSRGDRREMTEDTLSLVLCCERPAPHQWRDTIISRRAKKVSKVE